MAEQEKVPIPGTPIGEMTPEELKAEQQRIVDEKLKIIKDLNSINYPISATVFTHHSTWTIRNIAFWNAMKNRDEKTIEFMEKYLTDNKA